jgi:peptidyl-prolyl cis-trans isomerase B (cyclophilin B)
MSKIFFMLVCIFAMTVLLGCGQSPVEYESPDDTVFTPSGEGTIEEETMPETKTYAFPGILPDEEIKNKVAVIATPKGEITLELYADEAPKTVSNFVYLAKEGFYNGLTFHRVEPGFVVQGGDPEGTGAGGPGYTVPAEIVPTLKHVKGAVAMARLPDQVNPERNSSGSQYYITLDDQSFLDGQYTIFGKVIDGMNIVEKIEVGDQMTSIIIKDKE